MSRFGTEAWSRSWRLTKSLLEYFTSTMEMRKTSPWTESGRCLLTLSHFILVLVYTHKVLSIVGQWFPGVLEPMHYKLGKIELHTTKQNSSNVPESFLSVTAHVLLTK